MFVIIKKEDDLNPATITDLLQVTDKLLKFLKIIGTYRSLFNRHQLCQS